jgi:hypothetical protein
VRTPLIRVMFAGAAALLVTQSAHGQSDPQTILADANAAFQRGIEQKSRVLVARKEFSAATDLYLTLHRLGVRNSALYLRLGNAATLADRWPEAIWAYHLGLQLDPNDQRLHENLAFVRGKVIYPPAGQGRPEPDAWPPSLYRPTVFDFTLSGAIAYALAWIFGTMAWRRGSFRLTVAAMMMLTVATLAAFGLWRHQEQARLDRETPLVVLAHNTSFHRGNGASYPTHPVLPLLPRGMEVRRLHTRGHWLQVRLTTGEVGWVPANAALLVEP